MDRRLEGKTVLITGASRGIGKCIAEEMAQKGAVVLANARTQGCLDDWSKELSIKYDTKVIPIYCDITDWEQTKKKIQSIWREEGHIDVVVNNAGVEYNENIGMISQAHMNEMLAVNMVALINVTQLIARFMMKQKNGSIINMASIVGVYGAAGQSVYSATKGAAISFTKSAAKELGKYGIRVNAIAPGLTKTDMLLNVDEVHLQKRIDRIAMGRIGVPEDVAQLAVFLASDESNFISGQVIGVDGAAIS